MQNPNAHGMSHMYIDDNAYQYPYYKQWTYEAPFL
jgi:hypothetical protein